MLSNLILDFVNEFDFYDFDVSFNIFENNKSVYSYSNYFNIENFDEILNLLNSTNYDKFIKFNVTFDSTYLKIIGYKKYSSRIIIKIVKNKKD